jgi:hypothetical protein
MGVRIPEVFHQCGTIVGKERDADLGVVGDGPSDTAVVVDDDGETPGKRLNDGEPALRVRGEPRNQDERGTVIVNLVEDLGLA